ncbi:hypothetical protein GT347_15875 [Xylophilus rhododendri]|uniref:Uncharacterized protein n=1 Tax=Xylophilus rhododendri TaxID=2697032 RepID=A0A857J5Q0_9BURK|nr:hypothetical protein [Xylophilus rhododendri]QHI99324.1 hypothetical protein GT347_15875 [Xylophilus rhododendri]
MNTASVQDTRHTPPASRTAWQTTAGTEPGWLERLPVELQYEILDKLLKLGNEEAGINPFKGLNSRLDKSLASPFGASELIRALWQAPDAAGFLAEVDAIDEMPQQYHEACWNAVWNALARFDLRDADADLAGRLLDRLPAHPVLRRQQWRCALDLVTRGRQPCTLRFVERLMQLGAAGGEAAPGTWRRLLQLYHLAGVRSSVEARGPVAGLPPAWSAQLALLQECMRLGDVDHDATLPEFHALLGRILAVADPDIRLLLLANAQSCLFGLPEQDQEIACLALRDAAAPFIGTPLEARLLQTVFRAFWNDDQGVVLKAVQKRTPEDALRLIESLEVGHGPLLDPMLRQALPALLRQCVDRVREHPQLLLRLAGICEWCGQDPGRDIGRALLAHCAQLDLHLRLAFLEKLAIHSQQDPDGQARWQAQWQQALQAICTALAAAETPAARRRLAKALLPALRFTHSLETALPPLLAAAPKLLPDERLDVLTAASMDVLAHTDIDEDTWWTRLAVLRRAAYGDLPLQLQSGLLKTQNTMLALFLEQKNADL